MSKMNRSFPPIVFEPQTNFVKNFLLILFLGWVSLSKGCFVGMVPHMDGSLYGLKGLNQRKGLKF